MAQCLLHHGWLVLLKTGACCGLPVFCEVTTNWRAGCQKLACPVRREGRPESSSLPLSRHACRYADAPIRRYADTPIRRYADTPMRRYADTPIGVPNCGLSRSSKLNSKNNDSTKVW